MTRKEFKHYQEVSNMGLIFDCENPAFILTGVSDNLLSLIAKGEIDCQELAKRHLEMQGLNINGKWCGFDKEIE